MSDVMTIDDPAAAAALAAPTPRSIVFALADAEASLQSLSTTLGLSLSLLHYHVGRLRRLGLVRVERVQRRAGRPIALYRAAAASFVVPEGLAHLSPSGGLKAELDASLERDAARFPAAAIRYELGDDGTPRMRRVRSASAVAGSGEWWGRLRLGDAEATSLAEEIRAVVARYRQASAGGGADRLFYFALARG